MFSYNFFVALHIIFMVSWMAGLFYVVRLFVYHNDILITEKANSGDAESSGRLAIAKHLSMMERRLLSIIASPAMVISFCLGFYVAIVSGAFSDGWLHVKLLLVFVLIGYHFYCIGLMLKLRRGEIAMQGAPLRFFNEIAPMIFVAIVFLVSTKNPLAAAQGTALVVLVTAAGYLVFWMMRRVRSR